MTELITGCALSRPPGPKYARELGFAEIGLRPPLPRPPTLRRWRCQLPGEFVFALNAPRSAIASRLGPFRFDDDLQEGLQWTVQAARALDATAVVIRTPVDFTTSRRDRDRFAAFAERLPREQGRLWVWAPGGLWDPDSAYPLAEKLGMACAFDPLTDPVPAGEVLYGRLIGLGTRRRFSETALREIAATVSLPEVRRAYITFDAEGSLRSAVSLRKTASSNAPWPPSPEKLVDKQSAGNSKT
jgi:uncharacterized protein YecE (DUF72 family)